MQTRDSILRRHSFSSKMARNCAAVSQTCMRQPAAIVNDINRVYLGVSNYIGEISFVKKVNPTFMAYARWVVQLEPSMFIGRLSGTIIRYARICATNIVNLQYIINIADEWVPIKKCANRRQTMKKFLIGYW